VAAFDQIQDEMLLRILARRHSYIDGAQLEAAISPLQSVQPIQRSAPDRAVAHIGAARL
jgi:hypothetical protein